MNDLHDLLEELSVPEHDLPLDPHALLAQARRRVRRRRVLAAACVSVVALGAVGLRLAHHGPDDTVATEPASYADLDLTPLGTAEVEARCQAQMTADNNGEVTSFTIPDVLPGGSTVQPPHPWHVGLRVYGVPASKPASSDVTGCFIPESGADPAPLTVTSDAAQLRQICSANLRTDLTGWQQLAAAADGGVEAALFRSGNGYVADCYAQHSPKMGVQGDTGILPPRDWYGSGVCTPTAIAGIHCMGVGRVADHTATAVDVTLPSGRVVRTEAVDGYWAVAVRDDASGTTTSAQPLKAVAVP